MLDRLAGKVGQVRLSLYDDNDRDSWCGRSLPAASGSRQPPRHTLVNVRS